MAALAASLVLPAQGRAQTGVLVPLVSAGAGEFGCAVALDGERALVGARFAEVDGLSAGAATVFVHRGDGVWRREATLLAPDAAMGEQFGIAVALAGDVAFVGARGDDLDLQPGVPLWKDVGSVSVFVRGDDGGWSLAQVLRPADLGPGKQFGHALALDGDTLVVGARWDNPFGITSGSAYVFERDAAGVWSQSAKLLASEGESVDQFGTSVALRGDLIAVGSPGHDGPKLNAGAVYLFARQADGGWLEQQRLVDPAAQLGDGLGETVLLDDGLLASAALFGDGTEVDSGTVLTWSPDGSGAWVAGPRLFAADGHADDRFGHALASDGRALVVGAERADDPALNAGSVHVFGRAGGGPFVGLATQLSPDGLLGDRFGSALALQGGRLLVGARLADGALTNSGQAHVLSLAALDTAQLALQEEESGALTARLWGAPAGAPALWLLGGPGGVQCVEPAVVGARGVASLPLGVGPLPRGWVSVWLARDVGPLRLDVTH